MNYRKIESEQELLFMDKKYKQIRKIRHSKIKDYGGLKYYSFGLIGIFFDISRKFYRLKNLIYNQKKFHYSEIEEHCKEPLEDTIMDLINYCFMLLHEIELEKKEYVCSD